MAVNRITTGAFVADVPQEYVASLKNQRLGQLILVVVLIATVVYFSKLPGLIFGVCLPLAYIMRLVFTGKQNFKYVFSSRGVRMVSKSEAVLPSTSAINYWLDFEKNKLARVGNSTWKSYPALVLTYQGQARNWLSRYIDKMSKKHLSFATRSFWTGMHEMFHLP